MEKGYLVHLANTRAIQRYNGIKRTNDATDECFLAHLLRLNIQQAGHIYPKAMRHVDAVGIDARIIQTESRVGGA